MRTNGQRGDYRTLDASVPAAAFKPGAKGFETVQAFQRAIGDDQAAAAMLLDAAAASLRQSAMRPDGTLDPIRFNAWRQRYGDALRALPEGVGARFDDAARAAESIGHVAPIRRDGLQGALYGAAGALGKNVIGRMREAGMTKVDDLIRQAMLDPDLARLLLAKAPAKPGMGSAMTLGHRLRRLSMYAPTQASPPED